MVAKALVTIVAAAIGAVVGVAVGYVVFDSSASFMTVSFSDWLTH